GLFTVPLNKASQNRKINEITVSEEPTWRDKLWRRIVMIYGKAPFFQHAAPVIETGIRRTGYSIGSYNRHILNDIVNYIGMHTEIVPTTEIYGNASQKGQERIIDICLQESASHYINPIGGKSIYSTELFSEKGIELSFLRSRLPEYRQFRQPFVPALSILDAMMFTSQSELMDLMSE